VSHDARCSCGCCSGLSAQTPAMIRNRSGLRGIPYRVGTHSGFRASMLARLSSADYPALAELRTRDNDDPTIALLDGFAVMADVLTFYQERIANECYLRSATEAGSLAELSRLIGYRPKPGVAAAAYLAFRLQETPGAPAQAAAPVTVPIGTKVQSVPGPDEKPQTFETVESVSARVEWNAIPAQTLDEQDIRLGLNELYLDGIATPLQPGDVLLLVGAERLRYHGSERWDARVVRTVEHDQKADRTRLVWEPPLGHGHPQVEPADPPVEAFVLRQRAALFGHNAPDPRLFTATGTQLGKLTEGENDDDGRKWAKFKLDFDKKLVDLDADYPKVVPKGWLVLVKARSTGAPPSSAKPMKSTLGGYAELYQAEDVSHLPRSDFALSTDITRVTVDTKEHLDIYDLRKTLVLAQSERLAIAKRPMAYPVYGTKLALDRREPDLAKGQAVAVSGRRQRLRIVAGAKGLKFNRDVLGPVDVVGGDSFIIVDVPLKVDVGRNLVALAPEELWAAFNPPPTEQSDGTLGPGPATTIQWRLQDRDGSLGTMEGTTIQVALQPATADDATLSEIALIANADSDGRDRTALTFSQKLANCYDRPTVTVNANVALATHGETVEEVLGNGDATARDQVFTLKQLPLTWISASTPSGRASTLVIRVNGLQWKEEPTLFEHEAADRAFATRRSDDGVTTVQFGDGVEGARLPTGSQNLRAKYRKGIGLAGNVAAGKLTTLLSRPLGVQEVNNPVAASGGEDPESRDDIRRNAPLGVLTLDRAVSLLDYENFARAFAGIAKAQAVWIPHGSTRGIFLTIAGYDGTSLPPENEHRRNLAKALRNHGDQLLPLRIETFRPVTFRLTGSVKVADDAAVETVLTACRTALRTAFSFAARDFGQIVSEDEVLAVLQNVPSVVAADLDKLYLTGKPRTLEPRLPAELPDPSSVGGVAAAQILTLDPGPIELGVMA
jgi:hypothetical protein